MNQSFIKERKLAFIGHVIRGSAGQKLKEILKTAATVRGKGRGRKGMTWFSESLHLTNGNFKELEKLGEDWKLCRKWTYGEL